MNNDKFPTAYLEDLLEKEGYTDLVDIEGRGKCGLMNFAFTVGLCYGLDEHGYEGRYCFSNRQDAMFSIYQWDGKDDPPGDWIKHKGKTEYSNPNRAE